MYEFNVDAGLLLTIVAAALALLFDWAPGLAAWFDGLPESSKRLLNAGLLLLASVILFVGECYAIFVTNLVCDTKGALDLAVIWFMAVTVNQGVHIGLKPSASFKARILKK